MFSISSPQMWERPYVFTSTSSVLGQQTPPNPSTVFSKWCLALHIFCTIWCYLSHFCSLLCRLWNAINCYFLKMLQYEVQINCRNKMKNMTEAVECQVFLLTSSMGHINFLHRIQTMNYPKYFCHVIRWHSFWSALTSFCTMSLLVACAQNMWDVTMLLNYMNEWTMIKQCFNVHVKLNAHTMPKNNRMNYYALTWLDISISWFPLM